MKTKKMLFSLSVIVFSASVFFTACGINPEKEIPGEDKSLALACDEYELSQQNFPCLTNLPKESLSENEKSGLLFMREEEKLARDVYQTLYKSFSIPVFNNISKSEQRHTDAIKNLIIRYELNDPMKEDKTGIFINSELQDLYNELIKNGSVNRVEALKAGALIEETDILDLQKELKDHVDNKDITMVYNNLLRGSYHHLKAFVNLLKLNNIEYQPALLTMEAFYNIITD